MVDQENDFSEEIGERKDIVNDIQVSQEPDDMFNKQMENSVQTEDQKQQNRSEPDDRPESVNINVASTAFGGADALQDGQADLEEEGKEPDIPVVAGNEDLEVSAE